MDITLILRKHYPGKRFSLDGESYAGLDWLDNSLKPTEQELQDLWVTTQNQIKWDEVRVKRSLLLNDSDWTQILDSPLSDVQKSEWTIYREKLRNVPQDFTDPTNIAWPASPD